MRPHERRRRSKHAEAREEPGEIDAADESHDDEDEHIVERHTGVVGDIKNQPHEQQRDAGQLADRERGGDLVLLDRHELGEDQDEKHLADLRRLNIEGQPGKSQPAAVAGGALDTPDPQHGDEQHAEDEQQLAPLGDDVHIHKRKKHIDHDANDERRSLHEDIAGVADIVRGAGNDDDAVDCGCHAECKQQHVCFFHKFSDRAEDRTQWHRPLSECLSIVAKNPPGVN